MGAVSGDLVVDGRAAIYALLFALSKQKVML
jgi:hypothetical protein